MTEFNQAEGRGLDLLSCLVTGESQWAWTGMTALARLGGGRAVRLRSPVTEDQASKEEMTRSTDAMDAVTVQLEVGSTPFLYTFLHLFTPSTRLSVPLALSRAIWIMAQACITLSRDA